MSVGSAFVFGENMSYFEAWKVHGLVFVVLSSFSEKAKLPNRTVV